MNTRADGTPDGTNSGTYCNNYLGNNYSQEHYLGEKAHGPPHLKYCGTGDYLCRGYNETVIQDGWFYDLADLDQSVPFVRNFLKDWVHYMASCLAELRVEPALNASNYLDTSKKSKKNRNSDSYQNMLCRIWGDWVWCWWHPLGHDASYPLWLSQRSAGYVDVFA